MNQSVDAESLYWWVKDTPGYIGLSKKDCVEILDQLIDSHENPTGPKIGFEELKQRMDKIEVEE